MFRLVSPVSAYSSPACVALPGASRTLTRPEPGHMGITPPDSHPGPRA